MSELNDEFIEAYKRIDNFCKDSLCTDKGVTSYISEMRGKTDGYKFVPGWKNDLDCLVKYRHMRNNYSHEVGTSYYDICDWDDVLWLRRFYEKLINVEDPLSLYNATNRSYDNKIKHYSTRINNYNPDNFERKNAKKNMSFRNVGMVLFLILLIALIALAIGVSIVIVLYL